MCFLGLTFNANNYIFPLNPQIPHPEEDHRFSDLLELDQGPRDFLILTSRERPKSALYLRLKIVKGGPFGLCETPDGCKIGENKGGPLGDFQTSIMFQNIKKIEGGPFGTIKKSKSKKVS